ncbi:hypothetical protein [Nocardia pseudobrasiliensis]|uniref:hypothetical protein n=1 Tax=Nocardia pseudobrasiliensis TaxID=45979 RepID=UPI00082EC5EC|nr:hypothetical protein [Nocardia pseudobrasiliensis]
MAILDARTHELVRTAATWHAPKSVDMDKTVRIGLELGNGQELRSRIAALLPNTSPINGGTVEVGPTVKAKLLVDSSDAVRDCRSRDWCGRMVVAAVAPQARARVEHETSTGQSEIRS